MITTLESSGQGHLPHLLSTMAAGQVTAPKTSTSGEPPPSRLSPATRYRGPLHQDLGWSYVGPPRTLQSGMVHVKSSLHTAVKCLALTFGQWPLVGVTAGVAARVTAGVNTAGDRFTAHGSRRLFRDPSSVRSLTKERLARLLFVTE